MKDTEYGDYAYRRRHSFRKKIIFIPLLVIGGVALFSYVVMLLWNALIPAIFHLGVITFWQALGLLVLPKILFGHGPGGRGRGPWMRHRWGDRFKNMSSEERQRFREEMQAGCGHCRHDYYVTREAEQRAAA